VSISRKSTGLKKSSGHWLKSGKAQGLHLSEKMLILCFCVLPGRAEALVTVVK